MENKIWDNIQKVKTASPLVHNITNYVVMNSSANALLAVGASPVMAHSEDEVKDMVKIANALVINIGTLSEKWINAMKIALKEANILNKPVVFDSLIRIAHEKSDEPFGMNALFGDGHVGISLASRNPGIVAYTERSWDDRKDDYVGFIKVIRSLDP